jgi:hypothetical protein
MKPPCQCDFIKLSQTTLSELHAGKPPESLRYVFGGPSERDFAPSEEGFAGNFAKPDKLHNLLRMRNTVALIFGVFTMS